MLLLLLTDDNNLTITLDNLFHISTGILEDKHERFIELGDEQRKVWFLHMGDMLSDDGLIDFANLEYNESRLLASRLRREQFLTSNNRKVQKNASEIIPLISKKLNKEMTEACIRAVKQIGYQNAGTFEFLVKKDKFYFLEMNTRLQVEHTVSEQVTGIDIVKEQINIAFDNKLSFTQDEVVINKHSIECRINAEDPFNNFQPCPGKILDMELPKSNNVRNDFGVYAGGEVPIFYDSLIGKIIVTGKDRVDAIKKMNKALNEFSIDGIKTTVEFQKILLNEKDYLDNSYPTTYIENNYDKIINGERNV